jgi:protein translocase SecG subunit
METLIFTLHILLWPLCLAIIGLILLQGGAGDISSAFGGGGQLDSTLGVGAGRKMAKLTGWLSAIFLAMVTFLAIPHKGSLGGAAAAAPIEATNPAKVPAEMGGTPPADAKGAPEAGKDNVTAPVLVPPSEPAKDQIAPVLVPAAPEAAVPPKPAPEAAQPTEPVKVDAAAKPDAVKPDATKPDAALKPDAETKPDSTTKPDALVVPAAPAPVAPAASPVAPTK